MTPENHGPRNAGIGAPVRLSAPAPAPSRASRFGSRTHIEMLAILVLVTAMIAGWMLGTPHDTARAARAATPAQVAALVTPSAAATGTPSATATALLVAPAPATTPPATATTVPATVTPEPAAAVTSATSPASATATATPEPATPVATATSPATATPVPATATAVPTVGTPQQAIIAGFPSVAQWYSLDCEYAAAAAVTLYWGHVVSQSVFMSAVPSNANPHLGFRGNILGAFGGLTDYGVYAEALVPVLQAGGYNAVPFYGGAARLQAEVAAGHPVVVWITAGKYITRTPVTASAAGASFTLVPGEHAVVIYGYDRGGVYIMDVSSGHFDYSTWGSFLTRWSYFDQMALVITPR